MASDDTKKVKAFNKYIENLGFSLDSPPDRKEIHRTIFADMVNRTAQMFEYEGLPDTIQMKDLEMQLQLYGFAFIDKVNGKLYSFIGGLGGECNSPYYDPTWITIANPALNYNATRILDKDGILIRNDTLLYSIREINDLYSWYITDAFLTLRMALVNARSEYIINVTDDNGEKSATDFIKSLVNGDLSFVKTTGFDETIDFQTLPYNQHAMENIKSAIEAIQYLQGSWFRKVGLVSVFNMKREYVSDGETEMSEDSLDSLPIDMLHCREEGVRKVNAMFGTNISVRMGKAWRMDTMQKSSEDKEENPEDKEDTKDEAD